MSRNVPHKYTGIRPIQVKAIPHVVAATSIAEAARNIGVCRKTLHRWMRNPDFRLSVEEASREAAELARSRMNSLLLKAADTLSDVMDTDDNRARTEAARTVVYAGIKAEEIKDTRKRLQSLADAIALKNSREPFSFK